jgi:long-chain fatty acid transport protein
MRKRKSSHLVYHLPFLVYIFILLAMIVHPAYATNGYFTNGYSVESKALAGAGVALPQGSLDASLNPAAMAFVGSRLDVGLSLFSPNRKYTVNGNPSGLGFGLAPGTVKSDTKWFLIPSFGVNWKIDDKNSLGLSIFGNGGMNTNYDARTFGDPLSSRTGVDLMQLFITPTYARKLNTKHAIAIAPIIAYQSFEAKGLHNFAGFSSDSSHLTNNDHESSYGVGVRIGYLGEILPVLNIGATWQSKVYMSEFDNYKGLFAEQGDFDIPSTWTIGIAVKATPELTFLVDVQEIYYSDVNAINNPLIPNLFVSQLGRNDGAGFGWDDITVLKFGVQWKSSKEWTWRAGYSIGDQPIPSSEVLFNILAPGVIEQHATIGFTRTIGTNQELKCAAMYAFPHSVTGPNPLDPVQNISLRMRQWEFSVGYAWKF